MGVRDTPNIRQTMVYNKRRWGYKNRERVYRCTQYPIFLISFSVVHKSNNFGLVINLSHTSANLKRLHPFQSLTLEKDYVVQVDYAQSDPINN